MLRSRNGSKTNLGGMSRRAFSTGLLLLPAARGFAAAQGHESLARDARGLAPDGLTILAPRGSEANLVPIARSFSRLSGIDVGIRTTGIQNVTSQIMLGRMSGSSDFDIALPPTFDLPDLMAADAIMPIPEDPMAQPDAEPIYDHGNVFDDRRFGRMTDGDQRILFINGGIYADQWLATSWEDRTGTPFEAPRSWEVLDAQMHHFAAAGEDHRGGILPRLPGFIEGEFWLRFLAKGVWPLDGDFNPQFHYDEGRQVLEEMIAVRDILTDKVTSPDAMQVDARRFESGKVLCYLSYGGLQKLLNRPGGPLAGQLIHMPPPGGTSPATPDSLPSFTWGWSYTIPTISRAPRAAALFSAFAVSAAPSTEAVGVAEGFFDPFLAEHYSDDAIESVYGRDFLSVHAGAMKDSVPDFYVVQRGAYMASLARWLGLAVDGSVTPRLALESAARNWANITESLDKTAQRNRWRALRAAFPAPIASRLRDIDRRAAAPDFSSKG